MNVAVFSTKAYDREYIDEAKIESGHTFTYFEAPLDFYTADLTAGFDAVCVFVNDKVDKETIEKLAEKGIKLIVLRCAGFNNIDIDTATKKNIKIARVPAYSPQAVAEHRCRSRLTPVRRVERASRAMQIPS